MKEKAKIAVFVSGGGTNLQALIDAQKSGIISSGEIVLVVSNVGDAYALERAKMNGIDTFFADRSGYDSRSEFEAAIVKCLEDHQVDMIVLAGFLCILSADFTDRYDHRIINVHPSLIPSFCGDGFYGLKVHEAALAKGVKVTGATVHYVNSVTDGGEIIYQKAVEVMDGDTPEILQRRVMEQAEWIILPRATETVCAKILSERN